MTTFTWGRINPMSCTLQGASARAFANRWMSAGITNIMFARHRNNDSPCHMWPLFQLKRGMHRCVSEIPP